MRFGPLDGPVPNEITEGFAYLPFGGGRRKCIGDQFALFESIVALSMMVRRYDFTPAPDAPVVGMTTGGCLEGRCLCVCVCVLSAGACGGQALSLIYGFRVVGAGGLVAPCRKGCSLLGLPAAPDTKPRALTHWHPPPPLPHSPGATIHTTAGLWMNVTPRQNIPPSPPPRGAAHDVHAPHSGGAAGGGCPMHAGKNGSSAASKPKGEVVGASA